MPATIEAGTLVQFFLDASLLCADVLVIAIKY
jgi:hypothetical protein